MLKAYKIQSIVLLFFIFLFYIDLCIDEWKDKTLRVQTFGGSMFIAIACFVYFETIIIPLCTLFLETLKHIKYNRFKINTKKRIAIFAVISDLMFVLNIVFLPNMFLNSVWSMPLVVIFDLCIGITIINVIDIVIERIFYKK